MKEYQKGKDGEIKTSKRASEQAKKEIRNRRPNDIVETDDKLTNELQNAWKTKGKTRRPLSYSNATRPEKRRSAMTFHVAGSVFILLTEEEMYGNCIYFLSYRCNILPLCINA